MARITPITIPSGVEVTINAQNVSVKGSKGSMDHAVHPAVEVVRDDASLSFNPREGMDGAIAQSGTARAVINNMNLTLGYSHPINYELPEGVTAETPSQTEIIIKGMDKQQVGQIAAEVRAFRPPEPYKGKGVKYADEQIVRKEAKKK